MDATIELHKVKGSAATITEIAQRAGVGRVTVYRHFPDEAALFAACSGHYFSEHPLPDLARWRTIADPRARLREALSESWGWHEENRQMMTVALAETRDLPIMAPYHRYWDEAAELLAEPWRRRGKRRAALKAAIALSLSFDSRRTLVEEQGLAVDEAIELLIRFAESA